MKAARRIAGLAAAVALLAAPGLAQADPKKAPEDDCNFSKGVWTCYAAGPFTFIETLSSRLAPVGEYGECTDADGALGTPSVLEFTERFVASVEFNTYRASGKFLSTETVTTYGEPRRRTSPTRRTSTASCLAKGRPRGSAGVRTMRVRVSGTARQMRDTSHPSACGSQRSSAVETSASGRTPRPVCRSLDVVHRHARLAHLALDDVGDGRALHDGARRCRGLRQDALGVAAERAVEELDDLQDRHASPGRRRRRSRPSRPRWERRTPPRRSDREELLEELDGDVAPAGEVADRHRGLGAARAGELGERLDGVGRLRGDGDHAPSVPAPTTTPAASSRGGRCGRAGAGAA